jgi:hypothetical protein
MNSGFGTPELRKIALNTWDLVLSGVDESLVMEALSKCVDKFINFPPSAPQFRALCLSLKRTTYWADEATEKKTTQPQEINSAYPEINFGANVCSILKIMFPDLSWQAIRLKFEEVKRKTRKYYPEHKELDFLRELSKYSSVELNEVWSNEEQKCNSH